MKQGYLEIYTGDGKGKTTAAMGVALRSLACGYSVYVGQFMKQGYTGERAMLEACAEKVQSTCVFEQFGTGNELKAYDKQKDAQACRDGLKRAIEVIRSETFDVIILDEINVADSLGYFKDGAVMDLISLRPRTTELILTGRGACAHVIEAADLVTEMRQVKHYFDQGVMARKGIEM